MPMAKMVSVPVMAVVVPHHITARIPAAHHHAAASWTAAKAAYASGIPATKTAAAMTATMASYQSEGAIGIDH